MASWHGRPGHDTELDRFVNFVSTKWTWLRYSVLSEQKAGSRAAGIPARLQCATNDVRNSFARLGPVRK